MSSWQSEREEFFRILLHDDRNSYYFVSSDESGSWVDSPVRRDQLDSFACSGTANYYITHNGFAAKRRITDRTRQINALFFDLDCHNAAASDCEALVRVALTKISSAVHERQLPEPTITVDSGRGVHLYYVLEKSIPYRFRGKGEVNEKGLKFFSDVQNRIADILDEVLECVPGIDVDRAVFDHTRVSRIPGTYNAKAGRSARVVSMSENYHHLSNLAVYKPTSHSARAQEKNSAKKAVILHFHPLMMSRLNKIAELQEYRQFQCEGTRELMCFVFYNTAVQVYSREDARQRLATFNARYEKPLNDGEINGIVKAVDNVVNVKGERGHYILKAQRIVELLKLTEKEMQDTAFFASKRMIERMEAKRQTKEKRSARDAKVLELCLTGNMTQREIACEVGCSVRTVQAIVKKAGLTRRYNVSNDKPSAGFAVVPMPPKPLTWVDFLSDKAARAGSFLFNPQSAKIWHTSLKGSEEKQNLTSVACDFGCISGLSWVFSSRFDSNEFLNAFERRWSVWFFPPPLLE